MSKPKEHLKQMELEINWMNLDGHLKEEKVAKAVSDIQLKIHDARKILEELEQNAK